MVSNCPSQAASSLGSRAASATATNAVVSQHGSGGRIITVLSLAGGIVALASGRFSLGQVAIPVTDRLNPSLAPATVANVPLGLAMIASVSSTAGDWLTRTAETVFVMPGSLQMSSNGMIYGARLWDRTQDFRIRDPRISANLEEYMKQCLFYDILLGFKSFDTIANSNDILTEMGPGSPARGMKFVPESGPPTIVTCQAGYTAIATGVTTYSDTALEEEGRKIFPGLFAERQLQPERRVLGKGLFP